MLASGNQCWITMHSAAKLNLVMVVFIQFYCTSFKLQVCISITVLSLLCTAVKLLFYNNKNNVS